MANDQSKFDGQNPVSGYTLFHGKDGKSYYLKGENLSDEDVSSRVAKLRGPSGIDVDELQQRTLGQARATAARPITAGELNNPASPNFDRSLPGSFEGHPENVAEYVPASAGEIAGGIADTGRGNVAKGAHRIIGGASNAFLPALPFAAAAAPALTARALAGGALGQYVGSGAGEALGLSPDQTDLAGDIGALAGGGIGTKARIPTKASIALALRNNETGAVKLPVKIGSAALGAGTGYLTGFHGYGELGGMYLGPRAAEALIPKLPHNMPAKGIGATLPAAEDFYAAKAKDLTTRGVAQAALDRRAAIAARAFEPDPFAGAMPTNVPMGNAQLPVLRGNSTPFTSTGGTEIPGINVSAEPVAKPVSRSAIIDPNAIPPDEITFQSVRWDELRAKAMRGDRFAIDEVIRRGREGEIPGLASAIGKARPYPRAGR